MRERAIDAEMKPPNALVLTARLRDEIVEHLRRQVPAEAVGLLAAACPADAAAESPMVGERFYPGTNLDRSPTRYTMDPAEVIAALRDIEARGWRLGAIVHSHPASAAVPSATDLREAHYPEALMVIVSLASGTPEFRAWGIGSRPAPDDPATVLHEVTVTIAATAEDGRIVAQTNDRGATVPAASDARGRGVR